MSALRVVRIGSPLAALAASAWLHERVPDPMPIHWDLAGRPDAWAARALGLVLLPVSALAITSAIAWLTSRGESLSAKNRIARDRLLAASSAFLAAMHALVLDASLRADQTIAIGAVAALLGALAIALGATIPSTEPNRWMGVRTKATLRDPVIWTLVNRFGGRALSAAGVVSLLAALALPGPAALLVALGAIVVASVAAPIYAWMLGRARTR